MTELDKQLFLYLNSFHVTWLDPLMVILSGQMVWTPFVLVSLLAARKQNNNRQFGLYVLFLSLAIMASDVTASYLLKNIFTRLRPCKLEELKPLIYSFGQKCGGKYGFVSSHAANSLAIVVFTLRSLTKPSKHWYWLALIPVIVGYSRIYLGVHYPGDILGGLLVGLVWGMLLSWVFTRSRAQAGTSSNPERTSHT